MAVQQEIKSHLARLLATEDIVVEHKKVPTAQFNVHTRELILPLWEKATNTVYDMLVGHEVGHALFTPDVDWSLDLKVPQQFVNVVEDARIEKLMKRKYAGLAKTFYQGYNELHDKDFFELDGEDLTTFNLADRANLYFKIGSFIDLVFSTAEKQIISLIDQCETFEDVKKAALSLYEYCKDNQSETKKDDEVSTSSDKKDIEKMDDNELLKEVEKPLDKKEEKSDDSEETGEEKIQEPEIKTLDSLLNSIQDLTSGSGRENVYLEVTDVNLENIIIDNNIIHKEIDDCFLFEREESFLDVDSEYVKFRRDAQKEVSYLIKEFECRKAASSYSRSTTSRTGVLDTTKLQTYKFNEDLFKKVTILPDGKNHGLVFILDWSGSMQYVLQDTLKQLYNLLWFCKKAQIPFEVYAFTNEWRRNHEFEYKKYYDEKEYVFGVDDSFSLLNLFTSKVNGKKLEHQLLNIWRISSVFSNKMGLYRYPPSLSLSGTPLNESLICLYKILPQFQKQNKIEKVQCIILTDGEAGPIPYHVKVQRSWESDLRMGLRNINTHCFLRDRKLGKTYNFGYRYFDFTQTLIKNLKDKFPTTNFIGIRILPNREAGSFIRSFHPEGDKNYPSIMKDWKRLKSFKITNSGYDAYFGMSSNSLADDYEFDVHDDASKAEIKRAFVKSLKVKKLNKKVLGEFIELVV